MDDMTYSDNFFSKWVNRSGGGPSLEWVDSPNLDCPLSRYFLSILVKKITNNGIFFLSMGDSGHFVLARWTQEDNTEIEMTAFKVSMMTMTAGENGIAMVFWTLLVHKTEP